MLGTAAGLTVTVCENSEDFVPFFMAMALKFTVVSKNKVDEYLEEDSLGAAPFVV